MATRLRTFERLHRPLFEELENRLRLAADRNVGHESEILDEADRLALGRLGWTHEAPLRVVQLARLCEFALATDRRVAAAQMRERRRVGEAIEHLQRLRFWTTRMLFCRQPG